MSRLNPKVSEQDILDGTTPTAENNLTKRREPEAEDQVLAAEAKGIHVPVVNGRLQPDSIEGYFRLAWMLVKANMLPKGWPTEPSAVTVGLIAGFEAGLTLTQTCRGVMIVNNRPCLWGDVALAVVRRSPICLGVKEWADNDANIYRCQSKRQGDDDPILREFSIEDAKTAGLWGKNGPWTTHPKRMLQMKARAFSLRDAFPDLLGGMGIVEEEQDIPPDHGPERGGHGSAQDIEARIAAARTTQTVPAPQAAPTPPEGT